MSLRHFTWPIRYALPLKSRFIQPFSITSVDTNHLNPSYLNMSVLESMPSTPIPRSVLFKGEHTLEWSILLRKASMDSLNTSADQSLVSSFICLMVTLGIFLVMCGSIGIFFAIEKDIYTPPDTRRQSGNLMICGKVSS